MQRMVGNHESGGQLIFTHIVLQQDDSSRISCEGLLVDHEGIDCVQRQGESGTGHSNGKIGLLLLLTKLHFKLNDTAMFRGFSDGIKLL